MPDYRNKPFKLITELAKKQEARGKEQRIATLVTDPILKPVLGPNATVPLAEGEDPAANPDSVLQWFCNVRLDSGGQLLRDCIVPNQARRNIGQVGDPVIVFRDSSTGAWQVLGRADRITPTQSVKSYTTVELSIQYIRGLRVRDVGIVSPFYDAIPAPAAIVNAAKDGKNEAGLHRGVVGVDSGGNAIVDYVLGVEYERIPWGHPDFVWGVDVWGGLREINNQEDGQAVVNKVAP